MGIVRLLLALSVVGAHGAFPILIGGPRAVQIFFMISGFLISYVLIETRKYDGRLKAFYISRYLRLWPLYALMSVLTLCFHLFQPETRIIEVIAKQPADGAAFLIFTNITLFLQDWTMFLGTEGGQLAFDPDFTRTGFPQFWIGLMNPPAWSLGLELSFYAIAPFILHRPLLLWGLLVGSILLRLGLVVWLGPQLALGDPWRYRFFPTELTFFLLGALAQQLSARRGWFLWHAPTHDAAIVWALVGLLFAFPILQPLTGLSAVRMTAPLYLLVLLALPTLFRYQNVRPRDRWLGELSYPIYICHWLVLIAAGIYLPGFRTGFNVQFLSEVYNLWTLMVIFPAVLIVSWILNASVGTAVERLRDRFRRPDEMHIAKS